MPRPRRGPRALAAALVLAGLAATPAAAVPGFPAGELPPPPTAGTATDAADRATAAGVFTPERLAQANRDRSLNPFAAFGAVLGEAFARDALPATQRLLGAVQVAVGRVILDAKRQYPRDRPYAVDASLRRCSGTLFLGAHRSYPSGHAAVGEAWGIVLADLLPSHGPALLERGSDYGESRIVCGVHWPSDVSAGQAIGAGVAAEMLADPALAGLLRRARAELEPFG